jgi:predicted GNAT family N-acyltransferase
MYTTLHITQPEQLAQAHQIRQQVFVIEQGVPSTLELDQHESSAHHYLLLHTPTGNPCGAARWRYTDKGIKLERFAVLAAYRNQGAGSVLLRGVLDDIARQAPKGTLCYLHAQSPAVSFYLRAGFVISGEAFEEAGIEHYPMLLPL